MELTEQFILLQAPNPAAAENGRKLSKKGAFSGRCRTEDGTLYWADCAGSGKTPYRVSADWSGDGAPVCRCSCPSRQFPCKHALGLLFEILAGRPFQTADMPQDLAEKRARQAARAAKREAAPPKERKPNAAAQRKKLTKQLEGLDLAEKLAEDLLSSGLGTLAGSSAQTYEKLAKDLGSCYLTGPQTALTRIALTVRTVQSAPDQAEAAYEEALRILIALRATIKKSRALLTEKLESGNFSAGDSALYEALGGVWRLEELKAIGSYRENARLVQLSFDVAVDQAKREYVERGWWLDLDGGEIFQTRNLRPLKALKYVRGEDSRFDLVETPTLYLYPGEGDRRVRWETCSSRPVTPEEHSALPRLAQPGLAPAVKRAKGQIKNTLADKFLSALVPIGRVGRIGGEFVLEDPAGDRIVLRDRAEEGANRAACSRLALLPGEIPLGSALFGLMFYDGRDRSLCLHPYSVVTPAEIIRLHY